MSHVPNSQRKLFMKWKNIFCKIKIAFVDPGDIVVISVRDAAKAIIDIPPSPEPSPAPGAVAALAAAPAPAEPFWAHVEMPSPGELLPAARHRSAGGCCQIPVLIGFSSLGDEFLQCPGSSASPCGQNSSGIWAIPLLSRVLPLNQVLVCPGSLLYAGSSC